MQYPLTNFPRVASTEKLDLSWRQAVSTSPFTLETQVVNAAAQWKLQWTWPPANRLAAEVQAGWIDSLQGQVGTFYYYPLTARYVSLSGIKLKSQAYQYNTQVQVSGYAANANSLLNVGQYITIGEQLLRITSADLTADANGTVTINFVPFLRINYAAATAVTITNPFGKFRLASSDGYGYSQTPDRNPEFPTFQALEAVS